MPPTSPSLKRCWTSVPTSYQILAAESDLVGVLAGLDYGDQITYNVSDRYTITVYVPDALRALLILRGELEAFEDTLYSIDEMEMTFGVRKYDYKDSSDL